MMLDDILKYNLKNTQIYYPDHVRELCTTLKSYNLPWYKVRKKHYMLNCPIAFDIETSSFYQGKEKQAVMYVWQMSFAGLILIGSTWEEWVKCLRVIQEELNLSPGNRQICVYVHNLSYEFQFCRLWIEWLDVFAVETRQPVHATCTFGIEFKCSYMLSAYKLEKVGEHLIHHPVQKLTGYLDYHVIRHSLTPLTWDEIKYCINDVQVVVSFVYDEMQRNGSITKIPLTNTGYVRNFCRRSCLQGDDPKRRGFQRFHYMQVMAMLTISLPEYRQARRAFAGGYTHTSPFWANLTLDAAEVGYLYSNDFTSAYPGEMVLSNRYPMSKGELIENITHDEFIKSINSYFCLFDVIFEGLESTFLFDNYISSSKCFLKEGAKVANGRVVSASRIGITLTDIDYEIIQKTYKWKSIKVAQFRRYKRGYLPTDFVKAILTLYADKTSLKNVKGQEIEYTRKKGMQNSCYGMICQRIINLIDEYQDDDWMHIQRTPEQLDEYELEQIDKYNANKNRFLFYLWALVVTASCRMHLWSAILECGKDYIYADTDSIKCLNYDKHKAYFDNYNQVIEYKIQKAAKYHSLPVEMFKPKTIKGVEKPIGVWDLEPMIIYKSKFLGAKRYCLEFFDPRDCTCNTELTVSGLNKHITFPYLWEKYHEEFWDHFTDDLEIPKGYTGKLTHSYIDDPIEGYVTDYMGNTAFYHEKSCVHLEESEYSLSIIEDYISYIEDIQERES